ncbi:hypothetical protein D9758_002837 [Tetrapyrgos nigripes]|uniref:Uncharacterized protein n=1 Tax=Tetrapyrgos nigripes TaxID=182062 RepID=A0A8H5LTI8_9AGAR|nr:hypothetical protein D9758_002837 [Tetrapyrgos nigripes]
MAGTKRGAAEDSPSTSPRTRSSKVAKTDSSSTLASAKKGKASAKGGKKGPKATLPASQFKAKALPLHVNITHTPPVASDDGATSAANVDPGQLGSVTLVASSFNTGSYGWKGSKRITVELENDDAGEKEKVQVMLTINATVMGSKQAPGDEEAAAEESKDEEAKEEEEAKEDADRDEE